MQGFLLELPRAAGGACVSAVGLRLVFCLATPGAVGMREAPGFDIEKIASNKEYLTPLQPLASSPDGQRMAFTADSKDGPKVMLFH